MPAVLRRDVAVTSSSAIRTAPLSGFSSPAMIRSSVDLPLPLGPSKATSDPVGTSSETSSSATKSPNRLETLRIEMDIRRGSSLGLSRIMQIRTMTAITASISETAYAPAWSKFS